MGSARKSKFDMAVINNVRDWRIKLGYTQSNLASVIESSRGYVGQVESPLYASKYNLNHLNKLALEFGCSPKDFMPEKGIKEDYSAGRKSGVKKSRGKKAK